MGKTRLCFGLFVPDLRSNPVHERETMAMPVQGTQIEARLATRDDLAGLEAIETDRTEGLSASYLNLQEKGDFYVVVGLVDGEVMGRAILDARTRNELVPELKLLWVVPAARRQGLGVAITSYLESVAAQLGYDEIFLGVTPDNPAAIPLYISLDYTPTGEHRSAVNVSVVDAEVASATEAIYRKSLRLR